MKPVQVLELVRLADPVPAGTEGPSGFLSRAALLERIDERSMGMQTEQRAESEWTTESRRRRLIATLAGAAAVIGAVVVAIVLTSGGGRDVASPLEVGESINQAAITGDWEGYRLLFADDATYTGPEMGSEAVPISSAQRGELLYSRFDWDGDGTHSILDALTDELMNGYATGVTNYHSCEPADDTTAVCVAGSEGLGWLRDPVRFVYTYTVGDGLITHVDSDLDVEGLESLIGIRTDYHDWVRANHPELNVDASLFQVLGRPLISPETVEIHRQLIQEWRSQR